MNSQIQILEETKREKKNIVEMEIQHVSDEQTKIDSSSFMAQTKSPWIERFGNELAWTRARRLVSCTDFSHSTKRNGRVA